MAHVRARKTPPAQSSVKVNIRTSVSDPQGIWASLRYGGACPNNPGHYHFYRPVGQEILMVDTPSQHNQCIRVRQTDEGVNEVTTFDHSAPTNYTDSEALQNGLSTYALRGKARIGGGSLSVPTLYTMLRFVKAGGVEKVRVEAGHNRAIMHELPVKNQADILYYSGHGHSSTGQIEYIEGPIPW